MLLSMFFFSFPTLRHRGLRCGVSTLQAGHWPPWSAPGIRDNEERYGAEHLGALRTACDLDLAAPILLEQL